MFVINSSNDFMKFYSCHLLMLVPYMYGHDRNREDFIVNNPDKFNISVATEFAKTYEKQGLIDPLTNLGKSRVYIYHGIKDSTVYHGKC